MILSKKKIVTRMLVLERQKKACEQYLKDHEKDEESEKDYSETRDEMNRTIGGLFELRHLTEGNYG